MEKILDRDDKPDHILIETSGLALPKPLVKAFNWPEIRAQVTVDGVITVVDTKALAKVDLPMMKMQFKPSAKLITSLTMITHWKKFSKINCNALIW